MDGFGSGSDKIENTVRILFVYGLNIFWEEKQNLIHRK
jgi:hypothetical protein